MFFGEGLFGLALLVLWVYCIFDVIATDEALIRNLPKLVWLLIVIIVPDIGSLAWLLLGRPPRAGYLPGDTSVRSQSRNHPSRSVAPDDDPAFLAGLGDEAKRLRSWEDDLKRREDDLKRREGEDPPSGA
jgi:hypothetical protein